MAGWLGFSYWRREVSWNGGGRISLAQRVLADVRRFHGATPGLLVFDDPDGISLHPYSWAGHGVDHSDRPGYGRAVATA